MSLGRWTAAMVVAASFVAAPQARSEPADEAPVPAPVRAAVDAFLEAPPEKEDAALAKAVAACKGDFAVAAAALRTHAPLTEAKPGVKHGLEFRSGRQTWEYSILLPAKYDGKRRFPVLVLPDHGSISPEDGIGFWQGKAGAEDLIVFRPVITRWQEDKKRFPDQQMFAVHAAQAAVMRDALRHLRLHYAVDHDRFTMTGLSQAGYFTWYHACTLPDQFAGIVPESSGGMALKATLVRLAPNLGSVAVRILHAEKDTTCPYADAQSMDEALRRAGGSVELITYTAADYTQPNPAFHPGPHPLRLRNVLGWIPGRVRRIPEQFTRVLRHPQQGFEGRFVVDPPEDVRHPVTIAFSEKHGALSIEAVGEDGRRTPRSGTYRVSPEDVVSGRAFTVGARKVTPAPDLARMLRDFKGHGDPARLCAAELDL